MLFLVIFYVIFLVIYLPLNFYIVFRVHEMQLTQDHTHTAMIVLTTGIAIIVLISLITIASYDWSANIVIF